MEAAAVYLGVAAVVAFGFSMVVFYNHDNFLRRAGHKPPLVRYGVDYLGKEDKTNIVWQTPRLPPDWTAQNVSEANGFYNVFKWLSLGGSLFLLAGCVVKAYGLR